MSNPVSLDSLPACVNLLFVAQQNLFVVQLKLLLLSYMIIL